ncbi:MAG TPA: succinylglutamate desuccinylase/aspartoacylase family protein [Chloroflexota bacterium]|nr:succinylglutamate desuccinylase/aspartoacylase family protein [Chloroflexota bacterium]
MAPFESPTPDTRATRDYAQLAARIRAAAQPPLRLRVIGQQTSPDGAERYDLYLVQIPPSPRARPSGVQRGPHPGRSLDLGRGVVRVYLNGGTHGDEPAGAEAVTRFLEARVYERWPQVAFTVTPCLNPWGYVHNRREGPGGRDLNRSFRRAGRATPEISAVKRAMRGQTFDLLLDCHEDVDAPGLYVFAPSALGRAIVESARPLGPVHPGPLVDGEIPLKDSVVVLDAERSPERRRQFTTWPLPFYVGRYHRRRPADSAREARGAPGEGSSLEPPEVWAMATATIETPTTLPLEQRVAMHLAAVDASLKLLLSPGQ